MESQAGQAGFEEKIQVKALESKSTKSEEEGMDK